MSERYTKLSSLPENLYAEGAPVIVSAGNLLKDNQTGRVLAQLKIKNIAAKPLKAATVLIHPLDAAGKPMAGDTQQKYLDLTAKTGEEFGQKTAIPLPDDSSRGLRVEVTQVVFSDNSASYQGGALRVAENCSLVVNNCTFSNNRANTFTGQTDAPGEGGGGRSQQTNISTSEFTFPAKGRTPSIQDARKRQFTGNERLLRQIVAQIIVTQS